MKQGAFIGGRNNALVRMLLLIVARCCHLIRPIRHVEWKTALPFDTPIDSLRLYQSSVSLHRFRRDSSEMIPRFFQDSSEILPRFFRDSSEILQRFFRDSLEMPPRFFEAFHHSVRLRIPILTVGFCYIIFKIYIYHVYYIIYHFILYIYIILIIIFLKIVIFIFRNKINRIVM